MLARSRTNRTQLRSRRLAQSFVPNGPPARVLTFPRLLIPRSPRPPDRSTVRVRVTGGESWRPSNFEEAKNNLSRGSTWQRRRIFTRERRRPFGRCPGVSAQLRIAGSWIFNDLAYSSFVGQSRTIPSRCRSPIGLWITRQGKETVRTDSRKQDVTVQIINYRRIRKRARPNYRGSLTALSASKDSALRDGSSKYYYIT